MFFFHVRFGRAAVVPALKHWRETKSRSSRQITDTQRIDAKRGTAGTLLISFPHTESRLQVLLPVKCHKQLAERQQKRIERSGGKKRAVPGGAL